MKITSLEELVASHPVEAFKGLLRPPGDAPVRIEGLSASSPAFFIANLFLQTRQTIFILCNTQKLVDQTQADLEGFLGSKVVRQFPQWEGTMYDGHSPFGHIAEIRFEALERLQQEQPCIIACPLQALMQKIVTKRDLFRNILRLESRQQVDLQDLRNNLVRLGFVHASIVEEIGQFSVRGGIIDIFPFLYPEPLRVELWGDEIESIRSFDVFTQRSLEKLE